MFSRLTTDPTILGGKPIVRGTRISVQMILEWIASGASRDEIVARHPQLTAEDVEQAISRAALRPWYMSDSMSFGRRISLRSYTLRRLTD